VGKYNFDLITGPVTVPVDVWICSDDCRSMWM
jgi:hypothetical protein